MKATKQQKQLIHINAEDREHKAELVQWATGDENKTSCNDLSFEQANDAMKVLGLGTHKKKRSKKDAFEGFRIKNDQHKYVLSLLRQIGWTTPHRKYGKVADMPRFAKWLKSERSPVQKPLTIQTPQQTTTIINALESMLGKKYAK